MTELLYKILLLAPIGTSMCTQRHIEKLKNSEYCAFGCVMKILCSNSIMTFHMTSKLWSYIIIIAKYSEFFNFSMSLWVHIIVPWCAVIKILYSNSIMTFHMMTKLWSCDHHSRIFGIVYQKLGIFDPKYVFFANSVSDVRRTLISHLRNIFSLRMRIFP